MRAPDSFFEKYKGIPLEGYEVRTRLFENGLIAGRVVYEQ